MAKVTFKKLGNDEKTPFDGSFIVSPTRSSPRPMVSREQAVALATGVAETMGRKVCEVRDLADLTIQGVRTPTVYAVDLSNSWIAYLASAEAGLHSNDIVVIDKITGAVRYTGSA